jgi:hypothetical protein
LDAETVLGSRTWRERRCTKYILLFRSDPASNEPTEQYALNLVRGLTTNIPEISWFISQQLQQGSGVIFNADKNCIPVIGSYKGEMILIIIITTGTIVCSHRIAARLYTPETWFQVCNCKHPI